MDARKAGTITPVSKSFRYGISAARIAPPRGARKMVPIPAPIPMFKAILRSCGESLRISATIDPIPAAICAVGPSLPALPPVEMVRMAVTAFTNGTRLRILPSPWNARMAASVPCPSVSGASRVTSMPEARAPKQIMGRIYQMTAGGAHPAISAAVCPSTG